MKKLFTSYIFQCQTSIHAGDGSSTGTIDKPIQREQTTGFPFFRDSSTRGAVRESIETPLLAIFNKKDKAKEELTELKKFTATFGNRDNGDNASALDVLSSRLLFFPVRSIKGVFAYVTCPFVLDRFVNEMELFHNKKLNIQLPQLPAGTCYATKDLLIKDKFLGLEEFMFNQNTDENFNIDKIINLIDSSIKRLPTHFAIIDDTSFAYFTRLFTEKVTRNKIDIKTGVADDTGLFNEEFLPEESILYTSFGFADEFSTKEDRLKELEIKNYFEKALSPLFQLGGDKSIGKGLIKRFKINFETETPKAN